MKSLWLKDLGSRFFKHCVAWGVAWNLVTTLMICISCSFTFWYYKIYKWVVDVAELVQCLPSLW